MSTKLPFIIALDSFDTWQRAAKTQPIQAKHISTVLADKKILSGFLLNTLEGREPIGEDVMVCIGSAGEAWQQPARKLLQKYTITSITVDGWLICTPNDGVEVECFELVVPAELQNEPFGIVGQWGETLSNGTKNVQFVKPGDYILRDPNEHSDVWVVQRSLFLNTYEVLNADSRNS